MRKLSWFWDSDWRQRRAINQAADEIDALRGDRADDRQTLARLFALDRAQAEEIAQLRTTVEVLAGMLVESGAIDEKSLRTEIEARLAAGEPDPPAGEPVAKAQCNRCWDHVPRSRSRLVGADVVCDRCAGD